MVTALTFLYKAGTKRKKKKRKDYRCSKDMMIAVDFCLMSDPGSWGDGVGKITPRTKNC